MMTDSGTKLSRARETVSRTQEALDRNRGTVTEQDWSDALDRARETVRRLERESCPVCGKPHAAYALFPPACQKPAGDPYTYFVDGRRA